MPVTELVQDRGVIGFLLITLSTSGVGFILKIYHEEEPIVTVLVMIASHNEIW
jgi:hypothetical protein